MDKIKKLHQAVVRLKWLKSNSDNKLDFDDYCFKFDKIMDTFGKFFNI